MATSRMSRQPRGGEDRVLGGGGEQAKCAGGAGLHNSLALMIGDRAWSQHSPRPGAPGRRPGRRPARWTSRLTQAAASGHRGRGEPARAAAANQRWVTYAVRSFCAICGTAPFCRPFAGTVRGTRIDGFSSQPTMSCRAAFRST